jgi:hypothetical protein
MDLDLSLIANIACGVLLALLILALLRILAGEARARS